MKNKEVRNQGKKQSGSQAESKKSSVSLVDREPARDRKRAQSATIESVAEAFAGNAAWTKSQGLIEQANEATGKKRTKLAKEAIDACDLCVEAYVLLAQDSTTLDDAIQMFQQGVKAGEKMIRQFASDLDEELYWDVPEIQSYLLVLQALANCLELKGDFDGAIELYQMLLQINPEDHQAARFSLAPCLLQAKRFGELDELLKDCKEEPSAWINFTRALYLFEKGSTKNANAALERAIDLNPFVLQFMAGLVELPDDEPDLIELGGESEAAAYVIQYGHQWQTTQGALDWIGDTMAETIEKVMNDPKTRDVAIQKLLQGLTVADLEDDEESEEFDFDDDEDGESVPKSKAAERKTRTPKSKSGTSKSKSSATKSKSSATKGKSAASRSKARASTKKPSGTKRTGRS